MDLPKSLLVLGCPMLVEILNFIMVGYSRYLYKVPLRSALGWGGVAPVGRHWEIPIQNPDTGWDPVGRYQDNSISAQLKDTGRETDSVKDLQGNQG